MTGTGWEFWIDRGGTFTDVVIRRPDGTLATRKLLSSHPHYDDAPLHAIREALGVPPRHPIPAGAVRAVKMGTTVATNALLERTGERTALLITRGFGDALRIGTQQRPRLFDREIILPTPLYDRVIEVDERVTASGDVLRTPDLEALRTVLEAARAAGVSSLAVVFLHGYRFPAHEIMVGRLARGLGFPSVSLSHEASPLMRVVPRGHTTVVDAYLTPVLHRYVQRVEHAVGDTPLEFMQSNGGLVDARGFRGKDSILSGPAGGIVAAAAAARAAGIPKVIAFDMGGTSTDVCRIAGAFERSAEHAVAGVSIRAPTLTIHTVAAGGGSLLRFDGERFRVGPASAGADPGPASYGRGGPLTVTDCHVLLGALRPEYFPTVFGPSADASLEIESVKRGFADLGRAVEGATGRRMSPEDVASGFLDVAVANMAKAIKQVSIQRGYDVTEYALCCYGGAAGQLACRVADALGMSRVLIHPLAGVLSAYGLGLADRRIIREQPVEATLEDHLADAARGIRDALGHAVAASLRAAGVPGPAIEVRHRARLRYQGTDTPLEIEALPFEEWRDAFESLHRRRFGFVTPNAPIVVESLAAEGIGRSAGPESVPPAWAVGGGGHPEPTALHHVFVAGAHRPTPFYARGTCRAGTQLPGPAVVVEPHATTVIEPGWTGSVTERGDLVLSRSVARTAPSGETDVDPVRLEIFNNLFMSIAEHMGTVLAQTSRSVNMKERLDFSCAVFDERGALIANAPHMPVHLGSMGETVRAILRSRGSALRKGDAYASNAPYNGGTHLPDVTVVVPVFVPDRTGPAFVVAARGHHADIGGITPGSMPPESRTIEEEGVLLDDVPVVRDGRFLAGELRERLTAGRWPARNPGQNLADLGAQVAACTHGAMELAHLVDHYGLPVVEAYTGHVRANAAAAVRRALEVVSSGAFRYPMDAGAEIVVRIEVDRKERRATVDFTGSSPERGDNFNAPAAVCRAAVLYVFRTLVDDDIPLNEGCLEPLEIVIPAGSFLRPAHPAAVVAGNVETSQAIANALYGALGVLAAGQGTMNNLTFGTDRFQYYETICGGAGAGARFRGADAVHTHMTNSRLTDAEVLEWRHPVLVEAFAVRRGSGGRGRYRGGDGVVRRLRFLEPMTAAILSGHRRVPPFGLDGGEAGTVGRNTLIRADGTTVDLGGTATVEVAAGDVLVIETPGGGGFGPVPG